MRNTTRISTPFLQAMYRWVRKETRATRTFNRIIVAYGDEVKVETTGWHGKGPTLRITVPREGVLDDDTLFPLLVRYLAAAINPSGVRAGDSMGVHRQEIVKTFNDNADRLYARWAKAGRHH